MRLIRRAVLVVAISASWLGFGHAQETPLGPASDWQTILPALEATQPLPASQAPQFGNYYSAQRGPMWPPLPFLPMGLNFWPLGGGLYVYDDREVDYPARDAAVEAEAALSAGPNSSFSMLASSLLNSSFAYGNPVYFTNLTVSCSTNAAPVVSFDVMGGTNNVPWDILMSTNVAQPVGDWTWLGIAYTANSYSLSNQPSDQAFYVLAKPSKTMTVAWGDETYGQCDTPSGMTNAVQVTGGIRFSLALLSDGTVVGWGYNGATGLVPTDVTNVTMIASGWQHNVALLTNGTLRAWGDNFWGELNMPAGLTNVTVISAQALHTLALTSNGTVVAWGYNSSGETTVPSGLSNVVAIAAGYQFSLAVKADGTVTGWGRDDWRQTDVPAGISNVVDVAAGLYHSLALLNNGTVVAWGDNSDGETNVPRGLTNVVAIAAGGDPAYDTAYSLALKSDGTVVAWGEGEPLGPVAGLSNVVAIGAGADHALAIRTGPPTPVITLEPTDQYQLPGGAVTFKARATGLYGVTYQWQTNGVNLGGATNAALTLNGVQAAQSASYHVVVTDNGGMGSIVSSDASLYLVTPPALLSQTPANDQIMAYVGDRVALSLVATAVGEDNGFPLLYQWQFDGTNVSGATHSNYTFSAANSGTYSVLVTNAAGGTNVSWLVNVLHPGNVWAWGDNEYGQCPAPSAISNVLAVAVGEYHCVAAEDDGTVIQWGYNWADVPADLTNAVAVAAGFEHSIALRSDGTVETWGTPDWPPNYVPDGLAGVKAVAAGWVHNVALLTNGTVTAWGDGSMGLTNVPPGLTNVTAISAQVFHSLALKGDGTVAAWGDDTLGINDVPAGLSNVVAVAAGGEHSLALKADGTVVAWGINGSGQCSVPAGLSNVMAIAAGWAHSVALKNDGTLVAWGGNGYGQLNVPACGHVKLIAAGGDVSLAGIFSPMVQYPVDATKDLLLIYNTNSLDSSNVFAYYLQHRPGVNGAIALGIGCPGIFVTNGGGYPFSLITNTTVYETVTYSAFTNQILKPLQTWLNHNPTIRPQYMILFLDVPSRVDDSAAAAVNYPFNYYGGPYPSVSYQLATAIPGWNPFVTHLNMNGTNDCIAYINKLASLGRGKLIISASAGVYANTNYYFDDTNEIYPGSDVGLVAAEAVIANGASLNSVVYTNAIPDCGLACHITSGTNLAGYMSSQPSHRLTGLSTKKALASVWLRATRHGCENKKPRTKANEA